AGADDQVPGALGSDEILAGQLAGPIDADRAWCIGFAPWIRARGIESENEIGAEVDQSNVSLRTELCQRARAERVDGKCDLGFCLGFVDEVVSSAIDNNRGLHGVESRPQQVGLRQISAIAADSSDISRQPRAKVAAELPTGANDKEMSGHESFCLAAR